MTPSVGFFWLQAAGEAAGSKLAKAERLGVTVMTDEAFLELLREHGLA